MTPQLIRRDVLFLAFYWTQSRCLSCHTKGRTEAVRDTAARRKRGRQANSDSASLPKLSDKDKWLES